MTLSELKQANPMWFSKGAKKFAGDVQYWVRKGSNGFDYLLRSTYAFSDMFSGRKVLHYRLNQINPITKKVGSLIEKSFNSRESAVNYLKEECYGTRKG